MTKYENKPYVWWSAGNYPQKGYLKYNWEKRKTDRFIFMRSQIVPVQKYDLILECGLAQEQFTKFDLLPNNIGSPILNQRALNILSAICPHDFQAFPVTIVNSLKINAYENHDYFLINITHEVDSVDRETSYLDLGSDGVDIEDIKKLFFKPNCMGDFHLAREKYFHGLKLISSILVKAFKKEKIKGGSFLTDLESYHQLFPEEYLEIMFPQDPEAAKRYFVGRLNDKKSYEFFKTRLHKIPREILESLIEMTLSRSSFHKEQCEEIREIIDKEE
jgi:hypothetical protein